MREKIRAFLLFIFLTAIAQFAYGLESVFSDRTGSAIKGYDPVSYFTDGGPMKGEKALTHEWQGATWHFVSEENLQAFTKNPEKYAPQYGGYCAWAVSQNYTASTDPLAWNITDGRLYLNYSKSVQANWLVKKESNIEQGNINWLLLNQ